MTTTYLKLKGGAELVINQGENGTADNPRLLAQGVEGQGNLVAWDWADGVMVEHRGPRKRQPSDPTSYGPNRKPWLIEHLKVVGPHVPFVDTLYRDGGAYLLQPSDGPNWTNSLRPSPYVPGSDSSHFLLGGESIPVIYNGWEFGMRPGRDMAKLALDPWLRLEDIEKWPGVMNAVNLLGDYKSPPNAQGNKRDTPWHIRNWHTRMGGTPKEGWFNGSMPRWADGLDAHHYHHLVGCFMKWLYTGAYSDWIWGVTQAVNHACFAHEYDGNWAGMDHYEKGVGSCGDYYSPDWAKQWLLGPVIWWLILDKHPILDRHIQSRFKRLRTQNPTSVWGGMWGARIGARYLEDLHCAWTVTRDPIFKQKAERAMSEWSVEPVFDTKVGVWLNDGNRGTAPTSPWMVGQLSMAFWRWIKSEGVRPDLKPLVLGAMEKTIELGVVDNYVGQHPMVLYRMYPPDHPEVREGHPTTHTAQVLPTLRVLANEIGGKYVSLRDRMENIAFGWVGSAWTDVRNGIPQPISKVGIEFVNQGGGGFPKVIKVLISSLVGDTF